MRIVVTANGTDLDAPASPVFGRCSTYIFVDTETMKFEAIDNPAMSAPGGAGIQAAQFVIEQGAQAVLTGNVGPNAFNVSPSLLTIGTVSTAWSARTLGAVLVTSLWMWTVKRFKLSMPLTIPTTANIRLGWCPASSIARVWT